MFLVHYRYKASDYRLTGEKICVSLIFEWLNHMLKETRLSVCSSDCFMGDTVFKINSWQDDSNGKPDVIWKCVFFNILICFPVSWSCFSVDELQNLHWTRKSESLIKNKTHLIWPVALKSFCKFRQKCAKYLRKLLNFFLGLIWRWMVYDLSSSGGSTAASLIQSNQRLHLHSFKSRLRISPRAAAAAAVRTPSIRRSLCSGSALQSVPHSLPHKLPVCIAGGDRWAMTHSSRPLHFSHAARFCSPRQLEQPMAGERWGVRSR